MTNQECIKELEVLGGNSSTEVNYIVCHKAIQALETADKIPELIEKLEGKYSNFCGFDLSTCTKYGNETAEQQEKSYSTMMMYEIADEVEEIIDIVKQILEVE